MEDTLVCTLMRRCLPKLKLRFVDCLQRWLKCKLSKSLFFCIISDHFSGSLEVLVVLCRWSRSVSLKVNSLTKFLRTFTSVSLEMSFTFPPVNLASSSSSSFPAASMVVALEALNSNWKAGKVHSFKFFPSLKKSYHPLSSADCRQWRWITDYSQKKEEQMKAHQVSRCNQSKISLQLLFPPNPNQYQLWAKQLDLVWR